LKDAKNTIEYARKIKSLVFAPRDKILCDLIPYLVDEKDLLKRHPGKDGKILSMTYSNTFENNYPSLVSNIEDVSRVISNETSPQIIWYVYYQRWRVLNNWRNIINTIWDGTDVDSQASIDLRKKARDNAKSKLGGIELKDEIKAQLEEIPEGHPLRNLAKFQERL
ncbi:MAG: hypothetical protein H8D23_19815, partial [Candidatus Brocadiales bacterium]|nr:hypothetical protein [Candidatus Brocadiales bacterium]